jgi:cytochrome P450
MPHSFLFGHLVVLAKVAIKYKMPQEGHGQNVPLLLAREYPEIMKAGIVYMDVWPISVPMVSVFHPDMMAQFTQDNNQLKHPQMGFEFKPFTNNTDLVTTDGQAWKTGRAIFNPGFSSRNLLSLIPAFVEEAMVFRDHLKKFSEKGEVIKLVDFTTNLTVDIIGRATL